MDISLTRFPKNALGDFYTTGYCIDGQWRGECMHCELPEIAAPLLMAPFTENNNDTFFLKQPETELELTQAIAATNICCVEAVRYGGREKKIIRQVEPGASDYRISIIGTVVPAGNPWWKVWF